MELTITYTVTDTGMVTEALTLVKSLMTLTQVEDDLLVEDEDQVDEATVEDDLLEVETSVVLTTHVFSQILQYHMMMYQETGLNHISLTFLQKEL